MPTTNDAEALALAALAATLTDERRARRFLDLANHHTPSLSTAADKDVIS